METDGVGGGVGGDGGGLMGRGEGVDGGCCEGQCGGRSWLTWVRYVVTMQGTIERVDSYFRSVELDSSVARLTKVAMSTGSVPVANQLISNSQV